MNEIKWMGENGRMDGMLFRGQEISGKNIVSPDKREALIWTWNLAVWCSG